MSPTTIYCHMDCSNLLPLLSVKFPSNGKKPCSHHLPSINLIVQFQCKYTAVSELLTHIPTECDYKHEFSAYAVSFTLSFTDSTDFQSYLGQHLSPPLQRLFHTFVKDYVVRFYILSWDFPPPF